MRRPLTFLFIAAAVLTIVPGWSGWERLQLLGKAARIDAAAVALDPHNPSRRRVGALEFVDGFVLSSPDTAFGGYSALAVANGRVTLLSDGGNLVRFTLTPDNRLRDVSFANLPAGPGTGWNKWDRDSESLTVDPATGRHWVGFEGNNVIMRYDPGFTRSEGIVAPPEMQHWPGAGGPESLVRMPDGRFVTIAESARPSKAVWRGGGRGEARQGLIWPGDPVPHGASPPVRFAYKAATGYDVADAAALPDGRLLVLERAFDTPFRFHNRIVLVEAGSLRPNAIVRGRLLAALDAPLIHDNFEGIAATREGRDTIIWLVSDDNQTPVLQRTLLLRFRVRL